MLGGVQLTISFVQQKTCFAYINSKYSTSSTDSQCIQVLVKNKPVFLWAVFTSNVSEGVLSCNPIFARLIGLDQGASVFVSPFSDYTILDELFIETDSPDDQDLLESNAHLLQLSILDQLRLVIANQKVIVWVSPSMPIIFMPKQTGILMNSSRINVDVDIFNNLHKHRGRIKEVEKKKGLQMNNIGKINKGLLGPYLKPQESFTLRTVLISSGPKKSTHPYKVYVKNSLIQSAKYATMRDIPSVVDDMAKFDLCVEVVPLSENEFTKLSKDKFSDLVPTVLVSKELNDITDLENGRKIVLNVINQVIPEPQNLTVITYDGQESEINLIENFKLIVLKTTDSGDKYLVNDDVLVKTTLSSTLMKFKLTPESMKYALLNSESFRHCTVSAKCLTDKETTQKNNIEIERIFCRNMKSLEELVKDLIVHLEFEIYRDLKYKGISEIKSNVLITGSSGTGKSALCHIINKELSVWSLILQCRPLKGKKEIPEAFAKAIIACQEHSPSVLICDNIDAIVPAETEGGSPQDIAYYQRLASVIKRTLQTCSGVSVLMTATSMGSLHPVLKQLNGKPLFTAQFSIPEYDQKDRTELFKHLVNDKIKRELSVNDDDVTKMAMNSASQSVRHMTDYFNKLLFCAAKKKGNNEEKPLLLEPCKPDSSDQSLDVWHPIGGLKSVKKQLTECIFWPLKYPALFPNQSCGILLYGPPGTGKSLIGSCLANSKQMNFIAVKGPELLSKYIGQSEKAVRDIFDRADMKKPCILFFDEFDSLAPKRGHDSTGVTDRVVNQLLTRLDGAEGGSSSVVIGATSRPDLLDPALLRAGRLQTHLYCSMPDCDDRVEVLQALSRDVSLDSEVDINELASRTEGFSAADLKSLLVTAQLASLDLQLESKCEDSAMKSVVVTKSDIENALKETKPSLSKDQILFYDMIYKRFRGESLSQEERMVSSQFEKQRVTLA